MKSLKYLLLTVIFIICLANFSFATSPTTYYIDENGELIESGDFLFDENATIVDNEDSYENLYDDKTAAEYQEEYESKFKQQQEEFSKILELGKENSLTKLIVTKADKNIKTEYQPYYPEEYIYYYGYEQIYYSLKYQIATVKAENGNEIRAVIMLSEDVQDNKNIKPLKNGDVIYANIAYCNKSDSSDGETSMYNYIDHGLSDDTIAYVYFTEDYRQAGIASHDRVLGIVLLTIFAILALLLYSGIHGAKLLIPLFVMLDLLFVVLVPEIALGKNIILLAILISMELIILITLLKNGWSKKSLIAIISSIIVVTLIAFFSLFFLNVNNLNGSGIISGKDYSLLYNAQHIAGVVKTTINTSNLYIAIIIILSSTISATISSRIVELAEKYSGTKDMANSIIEESKTIIADYPIIISIIYFVILLPKYMALSYNSTGFLQIINSELVITDLSLLLMSIISLIFISPITAIISSIIMANVEVKQLESSNKK